MSSESGDDYSNLNTNPVDPQIETIKASIKRSNIPVNIKPLINEQLNKALSDRAEKVKILQQYNRLKSFVQNLNQSPITVSTRTSTPTVQSTATSSRSNRTPIQTFHSTPFTGTVPPPRTNSFPDLSSLFNQTPITPTPIRRKSISIIPTNQSQNQTKMNTLTAQDILDITNIVNNSPNDNRTTIRPFNGNSNDDVNWMEMFEYNATANNWTDDKKKMKLGTVLMGNALDWYALEVQASNKTCPQVKTSFYDQFLPVAFERHMKEEFRTSKQNLYETSANFIMRMRNVLRRSNQNLTEAEAVDFIMPNLLPQIYKEVIPFNPRTYADLKQCANRIEQKLKADAGDPLMMVQIGKNKFDMNDAYPFGQVSELTPPHYHLQPALRAKITYPPNPNTNNNNGNNSFRSRNKNGTPNCYNCGKRGHVQANCWYLNNNGPNQNQRNNNSNYRGNNFHRGRGGNRGNGGRYNGNRNYNNNGRYNNNNNNNGRYNNNNNNNGRYNNNGGNNNNWRNNQGQNNQNNNNRRNNGNANVVQNQDNETDNQEIQILNVIGSDNSGFHVNVLFNGKKVPALIDTGASVSFISEAYAKANNIAILPWNGATYTIANGDCVKPEGQANVSVSLTINNETKIAQMMIYVLKGLTFDVVIGYNLIRKFGIIVNGRDNSVSF